MGNPYCSCGTNVRPLSACCRSALARAPCSLSAAARSSVYSCSSVLNRVVQLQALQLQQRLSTGTAAAISHWLTPRGLLRCSCSNVLNRVVARQADPARAIEGLLFLPSLWPLVLVRPTPHTVVMPYICNSYGGSILQL